MAHFPFLFALAIIGLFTSVNGRDNFLDERQYADLREEYEITDACKTCILQKLFQQRMEAANAMPEKIQDAVCVFHSHVEAIKSEGFSEEEFTRIKQQLNDQIDLFFSARAMQETAAPFFLDADASALQAFQISLEKMQLSDLSPHLSAFLRDEPRALRIVYPESLYKESDWTYDKETPNTSIRFADNSIKGDYSYSFLNSPSEHIEPFYQLPLDEKEQRLIHELLKNIAEKNVWALLFKKKEMEKLGKKINHVHPMRFMGYILSEPKLKKWLREIRSSSFKWDYFIGSFGNRMKEENAKNNIAPYIPGMAHLLHVDQSQILGYFHNKDYEGWVKSLL
jgi:hypothetical protein